MVIEMYEYGSIGIIYSSFLFAVLAAARYWLYRERLRVPLKLIYSIVAAVCLISGGTWVLTGGIPGVPYDLYRVVIAILMFALSCVIIKAPVSENAFSYAFILAFTASVETTATYIRLNFVPDSPAYVYPLISAIIVIAAFWPGIRWLERMIKHLSELGSDRIWRWLDLACYSFLFMNLLVTLPHPADMGILYPIGRYLMLLGMAGIYKAVIRIMGIMRAAADARAELSLSQRRVSLQQSYYDRMITQMDEVRRARHDLRHHKAALSALIKSGDTEGLAAYINATAETEETVPVTGNLAADSVLLYFMDAAKALDTKLETALAIGRKTPLTDPDLCIVLGNLLENAVDAQRYLPPEQRYIRVTAKGDGTHLTLAVDNRFDGTGTLENGEYRSRKEGEGHGLGIASVRAVCKRYGGILQLEAKGDMFMAGVVIGL